MIDAKFRSELNTLLSSENDQQVVEFVLNHAFDEYPRPFFIWLLKKFHEYDVFES